MWALVFTLEALLKAPCREHSLQCLFLEPYALGSSKLFVTFLGPRHPVSGPLNSSLQKWPLRNCLCLLQICCCSCSYVIISTFSSSGSDPTWYGLDAGVWAAHRVSVPVSLLLTVRFTGWCWFVSTYFALLTFVRLTIVPLFSPLMFFCLNTSSL